MGRRARPRHRLLDWRGDAYGGNAVTKDAMQHRFTPREGLPRIPLEIPNHLSDAGVKAAVRRLRSYWRDRGYHKAKFQILPSTGASSSIGFAIRSNLVNGVPPG